jgi:hypothetical protein
VLVPEKGEPAIRNRTLPSLILISGSAVIMLAGCVAGIATSTATTTATAAKTTASSTTTTNYDGTYTGKFYYRHPLNDSVEFKNIEWIEDSFTLTLTLKTNSIYDNKIVILDITNISCSEPRLGNGIPTQNPNKPYQSVAYLPNELYTQLVNKGFYYIRVNFTNGDLEIAAQAEHDGDLIVSSDGMTLSNSPSSIGTEENQIGHG